MKSGVGKQRDKQTQNMGRLCFQTVSNGDAVANDYVDSSGLHSDSTAFNRPRKAKAEPRSLSSSSVAAAAGRAHR